MYVLVQLENKNLENLTFVSVCEITKTVEVKGVLLEK